MNLTDPHRPPHASQLDHARHHARSALSALKAVDPHELSAAEFERLSRLAGSLADVVDELAKVTP